VARHRHLTRQTVHRAWRVHGLRRAAPAYLLPGTGDGDGSGPAPSRRTGILMRESKDGQR
jgi:hypothetical protein